MSVAVIGLTLASVASAASRMGSHQPPVIRPHFWYVGQASSVWTGARYALAWPGTPLPGPGPYLPARLIDDQTGQVATIDRAGCYPVQPSALEPLDLPWVPFSCAPFGQAPAPELYSPATGQWQAVSPNPSAKPSCGSRCTTYAVAAAGRYWLEYHHFLCDSGDQHCSFDSVFQNVGTGALRQDPSGGATTVDLNAPNLTRRVCGPLRVPTTVELYAPRPVPGVLTFYGRFAVSIGADQTGTRAYLERCGTHMHRLLTTAPLQRPAVVGANTHEVVWTAHSRRFLSGLTLPGLRPFTIRLPNRLVARSCPVDDYSPCVAQIALTNHRLYLLQAPASNPEQLWVATNPRPATQRRR